MPIIGLITNLGLAVYLFTFSPIAWYVTAVWLLIGLLLYYMHFSRIESMEKPSDILHEEVLVSRNYSVLIPVASPDQARILGHIGALIATHYGGEILALSIAEVPPQLSLADGRYLLKDGRQHLEMVIDQARDYDVPVHTMIRLGRSVAEAVRKTAVENASDLLVIGWPGTTNTAGRVFGSVIDPIVDNPPTDVAVVRYRKQRTLHSILVPVAGGPNSLRSIELAVSMALQEHGNEPPQIMLYSVLAPNARESADVRVKKMMDRFASTISYPRLVTKTVEHENPLDCIVEESEAHDLVVIGASEEPLFENILVGNLPEEVARRANVTVIMVKRRSGRMHSFLRQTILEPTTGASVKRDSNGGWRKSVSATDSSDS